MEMFCMSMCVCNCMCISVCVSVWLWPQCCLMPGCSLVQVAVRWQKRLGVGGSTEREEAGHSWLALSNDLCIMKDGDNISHSLQGSTLWQNLHIHIFSLPLPSNSPLAHPPLFFFHYKLFFLWAGHLPSWQSSGWAKINKYVCREAHDLSRCHRNMARCWHYRTPWPCVFSTA